MTYADVSSGGGVYADTSKLTNAAKQLIKVARSEVSEIEACPDCYMHSRNLPRPQPTWFIEPCRRPHPLVWAKLKGFPFWPAKAMPRLNSQGFVDVRFFGEHDRAWVSPKDLYLYSEEPPAPSSRKRKSDMDECVREITRHCRKLELMFGQFKFAPPKVPYNPNDPMQITLLLPKYTPVDSNNRPIVNSESFESKKKTAPRKRSPNKSQSDESVNEDKKQLDSSKGSTNGDNREKEEDEATARKVQKLDFDDAKDTSNSQHNLSSDRGKLSETVGQEVAFAQIKTAAKDGPKRAKTPLVKDNENCNITSLNRSTVLDKSSPHKAKSEISVAEQLQLRAIRESPPEETPRVQKKSTAKTVASPRRVASQNAPKTTLPKLKNVTKAVPGKVYKPKKQIVDKLKAEKARKSMPASKENKLLTTTPNTSKQASKKNSAKDSASAKRMPEMEFTLSSPVVSNVRALPRILPRPSMQPLLDVPVSFTPSTDPKSVLYLMVNNGTTAEVVKQRTATMVADYPGNTLATVQREATLPSSPQKKESKAKKTFPSKSRDARQVSPRTSATTTEFVAQVSTTKPSAPANTSSNTSSNTPSNTPSNAPSNATSNVPSNTSSTSNTYQLLPPEAGPISARLHRSAQELARRMGQLMEEAYKEVAAEAADGNSENGSADNYQATIFYLRMQIEHMKWQHQQQIAELKHNAGTCLSSLSVVLYKAFLASPFEQCFRN